MSWESDAAMEALTNALAALSPDEKQAREQRLAEIARSMTSRPRPKLSEKDELFMWKIWIDSIKGR